MDLIKTIPIAEVFTSVHGEGTWAGTRMTFFRTAGCNVGKVQPKETLMPIIPLTGGRSTLCTTYDGRTFPCDTDYQKTEDATAESLLARIPPGVRHVCISGGEPFLHLNTLYPLHSELMARGIKTHWETSGTIAPPRWIGESTDWITCSPKNGYLVSMIQNTANEIRLMVDKHFTEAPAGIEGCRGQVYLCPIASTHDIMKLDRESLEKCLHLICLPPFYNAKISIQMHKILNVR
jgi:organic radical activating enzyme